MRKPVAVITNKVGNVEVYCDDGTVWGHVPPSKEEKEWWWVQLGPPLPGSKADVEGTEDDERADSN